MPERADLSVLSAGAWGLAALSASLETGVLAALAEPRDVASVAAATGVPAPLVGRLLDVLVSLGFATRDGSRFARAGELPDLALLAADLRSGLLQTHELFAAARRGELSVGWSSVDEDVLQAQGRCRRARSASSSTCCSRACPGSSSGCALPAARSSTSARASRP